MASCAPVKPFLKILDLPYILLDILKNELFCYQLVTRKMGENGRKNAAQTVPAYDLLTESVI